MKGGDNMIRLQTQLTCIVIGSKGIDDQEKEAMVESLPSALTIEVKTFEGKTLGILVANPKIFSTGSVGFFGNGKLTL